MCIHSPQLIAKLQISWTRESPHSCCVSVSALYNVVRRPLLFLLTLLLNHIELWSEKAIISEIGTRMFCKFSSGFPLSLYFRVAFSCLWIFICFLSPPHFCFYRIFLDWDSPHSSHSSGDTYLTLYPCLSTSCLTVVVGKTVSWCSTRNLRDIQSTCCKLFIYKHLEWVRKWCFGSWLVDCLCWWTGFKRYIILWT